jgi:dolichol-phosphate mannosyltransferase
MNSSASPLLSSPNKLEPTINLPMKSKSVGAELCIVVPTFNERNNVLPLLEELCEVLQAIEWEIVFVDDDSMDGTAKVVRELGREWSRVRCIQRIGRRGLSSACIEGMLGSSAPYLAVMDGDLQHDPKIIPTMLELLKKTDAELVVGSRYTEGGSTGSWAGTRLMISRFATRIGYSVVPATVKDPMSGFFVLRRSLLEDVVHDLSGLGFKILLDIFASARRPIAVLEVPFVFRGRRSGESKLDSLVVWEHLMLLGDKLVGRYVSVRFLAFGMIGGLGVGLHLFIVTVAYGLANTSFVAAQATATAITMVCNYALNNILTYRDKRRRGMKWLTGLASFLLVCSVGALANVGIASYLFNRQSQWVLSSIAGIFVGAVWNYSLTSVYTWGRSNRS